MLDCFKNDSEHVYGLVVQKKDAQTDPSSLTMCVSKLATASGQTPTKRIIDSSQGFVAGIQNFTKNLTVGEAEATGGCEKKERGPSKGNSKRCMERLRR